MNHAIVTTITDRCKRCYSCIRECPAAAIRVVDGQAKVIEERCISCGHCVKVCSQDAKQIFSEIDIVFDLLRTNKVVAIVAPSFAASFPENYKRVPTALRKLGFTQVVETAFGADLIANHYSEILKSEADKTIISSACPAVVSFIQKYYVELVPNLAKVVSPMIALGRYLKQELGDEIKIVFIGPCVAKKHEAVDDEVYGVIDAVLTFHELKEMFDEKQIEINSLEESEFDPPHAMMGKAYPLAGGLLKTTDINDDVLEKDIIVVEGKKKVLEIIEEIAHNNINAKFTDILFCEGCISGPAIDTTLNYYSRREKVIDYIQEKINNVDRRVWKSNLYNARKLNLIRNFKADNQRRPMPDEEKIREILAQTKKFTPKDELNCGACGYETCREYAIAIAKGLAEKEMCLPYLIDELRTAYENLSNTQEQLRIAEKLASIGQLAAGVAHEINNPLGTILLYTSMLKKELEKYYNDDRYKADFELIIEEANRCKNIVSNLLNFARQGKLNLREFDVKNSVEDVLKPFTVNPSYRNIDFILDAANNDCKIVADEDQLKQVFINVIKNACDAMSESEKKLLKVNVNCADKEVTIEFSDTGIGIPKENQNKIFTPFFTTKSIGKGTGLGLAISYGIIKMHKGNITFTSEEGKGTIFKITLPKNQLSNG
ncbi:NtrC family signal transduction histidine kinase [Ignavibacterium album JCM 16511]|uniref:histidine kinase n=1 Tax=Ignavibacterium album (strain DSM 19864 / JCM 16511 / NBRC 101810 / Mat9-16) TaxID=945713 RepID=I0AGY7_IGNAJ|nr:[Fe-Fe] hydrogenase large subunit C-terminal domain-containing protein [Ignavibacterium album]AFH48244.1 NtrC family signal transduction histidine kinase [Ignavibacterium album JCM 16511]